MSSALFDQQFEEAITSYGNLFAGRNLLNIEQNPHNKLWPFFLFGDCYYFIIDHQTLAIDFVSKEVEDVLGYLPTEFAISSMDSKIHPDDRFWLLTIRKRIVDFFSQLPIDKLMKYKVRYDLRYKKKNGQYTRILHQGILLEHDDKGTFTKTLNVHTDISYLKQDGKPVLSFIGLEGEPSFIDVASENVLHKGKKVLTERERQVLKLLINGKLSKEIGSILKISKQTVDTHRKNMLRKKKLSTTGELVGKAIRLGWI
ncbi:MAG TPA: LuxR C-terminal-related transcriptional regulator [Flavitalea sp.]|nr:LuxR C-terminal-related transcriptional regulator [Flavitalea sp.]